MKSPLPISFSAPVAGMPVATRASSADTTRPTNRNGKFAFNNVPITRAEGFCVQATR